jgi:hypothetical protein
MPPITDPRPVSNARTGQAGAKALKKRKKHPAPPQIKSLHLNPNKDIESKGSSKPPLIFNEQTARMG